MTSTCKHGIRPKSNCRDCDAEYQRDYRNKDIENRRAQARDYYGKYREENREKINEKSLEWYHTNKARKDPRGYYFKICSFSELLKKELTKT